MQDVPLFRDFAGLGGWDDQPLDESTILRFRHVLEKHKLAPKILQTVNDMPQLMGQLLQVGTVVDATLIATPSSTKNSSGERDQEMKNSKKGALWFFGMKADIDADADAESDLVQLVRGTAVNVNDAVDLKGLLHHREGEAWGDARCQGVGKRPNADPEVRSNVAMRLGKRRRLYHSQPIERFTH